MRNVAILFCLLFAVFGAKAEQKPSRESVAKLMELTEVSKMMDVMYLQMSNMFDGMSKQLGISETEKPAFDKYMQKVAVLLQKDLNWNLFKEPMIDIYVENFTEDEVNGLIKFYQSDLGLSMTKKMPVVMQDTMLVSQKIMIDFLPKIQSLAMEMREEIQLSRDKSSEE